MTITELVLENVGVYRGRNTFSLAPTARGGVQRPVVLFGGKNGAGKTTILNAVRLCLYGSLSVGDRLRSVDYSEYLSKRVHKPKEGLLRAESARVELEFRYAASGVVSTYRLVRSWYERSKGPEADSLAVYRDGKRLDAVSANFWQEFIKEMIPPGVAALCFFDGEKVTELAHHQTADAALTQAIHGLLGLDVVEKLQVDLKFMLSRERRSVASSDQLRRLAILEGERKAAIERKEEGLQDLASAMSELDGAEQRLESAEKHFRAVGGAPAQGRDELLAEQAAVKLKMKSLEIEAADLCAGLLPLGFAGARLGQLEEELRTEAESAGGEAARLLAYRWLDEAVAALSQETAKDKTATRLLGAIRNLVEERVETAKNQESGESVHQVTPAEALKLIASITEARVGAAQRAVGIATTLEEAHRRWAGIEKQLNDLLDPEQEKDHGSRLVLAGKDVGAWKQKVAELEERRIENERLLNRLQQEIDKIEKEKAFEKDQIEKVRRIEATLASLGGFRERLLSRRLEEVEQAFEEAFGLLSRKDDLIQQIKIDPHTLTAELYGGSGARVSQADLSAGEKQIYAISLLWALTRCSRRSMPFIVDTPLARLDSDHRKTIVERFFRLASHQVIVLSHDEEIDARYFDKLGDSVSHTYHLEFDQGENCTKVREGYFDLVPSADSSEVTYAS